MSKGALLRWLENRYLQRHLHGRGVEIGALWRRFPVPAGVQVFYADKLGPAGLEGHYPELKGSILRPDILAEATQLPVRPATLDFVIASHVLEHLPDPLLALRAWYDSLAPGGVLLLKVPDKRHTFDAPRARTPLSHLLEEHRHPERFDPRAHSHADWVQHVGSKSPSTPEFDQEVQDLIDRDYSIHFHVWIDEDLREIINLTRQEWGLKWEPVVFWRAHFYRKETTILLRRE